MKKMMKKIYIVSLVVMFSFIIIKTVTIYRADKAGTSDGKNTGISNVEDDGKNTDISNVEADETESTDEMSADKFISPYSIVIENYDTLFEWYNGKTPKVNTYNTTAQKSREYLAYGISMDEYDYLKKCYDEDVANNNDNPLTDKYAGHGKYNKDKVLAGSEMFSRKYMLAFSRFTSTEFCDKFPFDVDDRYLMENTRSLIMDNLSDDRREINNIEVYNASTGELCENQKVYYAFVQIGLEGRSNWVQDVLVAPRLSYLKDDGDVLAEYDSPVYISVNGERLSGDKYGVYIESMKDDGTTFYDYSDEACRNSVPQCHCPLRIGESSGFYVIYLIPEAYLEDAYLVYNDLEEYENVDYTYNLLDVAIYDLQNEFEFMK